MPQLFKGDAREIQFYDAAAPVVEKLSSDKTEFFNGAFGCFLLGELLFDNKRAPLAGAIPRRVFRIAFPEIFDAFVLCGSFESYLTVFRKIFGDSVDVAFTVPGPGLLTIAITANAVELTPWLDQDGNEMLDQDDNNILFQSVKGFNSQYELEQMLFEMTPAGIATTISLTIMTSDPIEIESGGSLETEEGDILETE